MFTQIGNHIMRKRREGRQLPVMAGQAATTPGDTGEKGTDA